MATQHQAQLSFRCSVELFNDFTAHAQSANLSKSALLRNIVSEYLSQFAQSDSVVSEDMAELTAVVEETQVATVPSELGISQPDGFITEFEKTEMAIKGWNDKLAKGEEVSNVVSVAVQQLKSKWEENRVLWNKKHTEEIISARVEKLHLDISALAVTSKEINDIEKKVDIIGNALSGYVVKMAYYLPVPKRDELVEKLGHSFHPFISQMAMQISGTGLMIDPLFDSKYDSELINAVRVKKLTDMIDSRMEYMDIAYLLLMVETKLDKESGYTVVAKLRKVISGDTIRAASKLASKACWLDKVREIVLEQNAQ